MDIPNFLEPWYGIGAVPAAYGADYVWNGDLAPAVMPLFKTVDEALAAEFREIEETPVGRRILEMIEYFLEKTGGRIPLSLSDVQSPLDSAAALIETSEFYMACLEDPDSVKELLGRITDLTVRFGKKQAAMIGKQLVFPGHGFSSSRNFSGMGFSDDNSIMLSPEIHREICDDSMVRFGQAFGGFAFHCCGNWSKKTETVKALSGLKTVDGAFTIETDPSPNPTAPFRDSFAGSGICVNARMVGNREDVLEKVKELQTSGMKLIIVTYCASAEEQKSVYDAIHGIC
jgi:uroporphyrinogen-III decarboxylase